MTLGVNGSRKMSKLVTTGFLVDSGAIQKDTAKLSGG